MSAAGGRDLARLTGKIMTVRGPLEPSELGITLSHDHILVDLWDFDNRYDVILDDEDIAREELERYAAVGGGAICDPTNIGLHRDPERLRRLSEATGVHVVMGAGWYREKLYPPEIATTSTNDLADALVAEIVDGVDGSGVRPGFVGEIGTERGAITPAQERVFRAAARAHRRTGVPLLTHTTHWGELAVEQLDLFADEGVDASAVIVSHLGDRRGIGHVLPIVERGAWASIDNLAFVSGYAPLEFRADNVAELCAAGYAGQLMLSNDICELGQLAAYGGAGYGNIITNFLPMLRERGVSEESIHTMLVENPARAFAFRDLHR
ncbi:phosphotriesterase family protein [Microbacterium sp. 2MCAF23]|uniref:phosphotriesterase family protein n=1 Tax=Microbacterium sp. 2MCAF23 TaxID=3232985 RepID=UPI003F979E54